MKKQIPYFVRMVLFLIVIVISSCKHDPDEANPNDPTNPSDTNNIISCNPDTTYFVNDVLPIFQSSCALSGCHDGTTAQDGIILSDYSHIIASNQLEPGNADDSEIFEKITETDEDDRMPPPPFPRLDSEQIASIRNWINQGAKNNKCDSDCDTTLFTFSGAVKSIIDQNCKGCHNAALANGGVQLDNYTAIASIAADGRLLGTISHAQGFTPMPFNGTKLSDCKITQIRKWIEAGSQNN